MSLSGSSVLAAVGHTLLARFAKSRDSIPHAVYQPRSDPGYQLQT